MNVFGDKKMRKKVILVTGASSGIGKTTAEYLAKQGHIVIGTSRHAKSPDHISVSSNELYPLLIYMDVTDEQSVEKVVSFLRKDIGRLDVVINNAGCGISGPIEETSLKETRNLFETNVFGVLSIIKQVLPMMRSQKNGLIINMSSIGGVLGLPYQGIYSATKFAIEGLTEALRMEVASFGINVVLVEPGDFRTNFTMNRKKILHVDSIYSEFVKKTTTIFEHDEHNGSDPNTVAQLIHTIIKKRHPKLRYRVGSFSQRFAAMLKGIVSDRFIQWILMKYYKLI